MKFIFADSLDYVDPAFDFLADRSPAGRQPYWDDAYPHEILGYAPYDGVLVSRGIVGDHRVKCKYTASQARRFALVGARKFLRLDKPEFAHLDIFGDCGAFTYVQEDRPPYTPAEMAEFYDECGFTHGCSVDHIIFDFDPAGVGLEGGSQDARHRFEITLENADGFRRESIAMDADFTPLGVIQGWSPGSMAEAARRLVAMGYGYLAIGGMVPLKSPEIKLCLEAIRGAIPASTRMHILGFAKADDIDSWLRHRELRYDISADPRVQGRQAKLLSAGGRAGVALLHLDPRPSGDREPQVAAIGEERRVQIRGSGAHGERSAWVATRLRPGRSRP